MNIARRNHEKPGTTLATIVLVLMALNAGIGCFTSIPMSFISLMLSPLHGLLAFALSGALGALSVALVRSIFVLGTPGSQRFVLVTLGVAALQYAGAVVALIKGMSPETLPFYAPLLALYCAAFNVVVSAVRRCERAHREAARVIA